MKTKPEMIKEIRAFVLTNEEGHPEYVPFFGDDGITEYGTTFWFETREEAQSYLDNEPHDDDVIIQEIKMVFVFA
jgi:hypothetical protein